MDRREEAILVYDTLVQRFGDAPEAELRKQVARALNGIGFPLLCQAKRVWAAGDEQAARSGLLEAQQKLIAATMRDPDSPMVLGNVAYVDFLLGNKEQARALMSRAIGLGGEEIRRGELADADIHPLPQDEEFKELVRSIPAAGAA